MNTYDERVSGPVVRRKANVQQAVLETRQRLLNVLTVLSNTVSTDEMSWKLSAYWARLHGRSAPLNITGYELLHRIPTPAVIAGHLGDVIEVIF
jgi:hypothetical protein